MSPVLQKLFTFFKRFSCVSASAFADVSWCSGKLRWVDREGAGLCVCVCMWGVLKSKYVCTRGKIRYSVIRAGVLRVE